MPVICAATGCNNKFVKGSEIRFYRFPLSKPQLASKWVHSLGMKNFIPTANTCLCSEHFRPDCFRDYNGKQFLREDAVPTIFTQGQDSSKVQDECGKSDANSSRQRQGKRGCTSQRQKRRNKGEFLCYYCVQNIGAKSRVYDTKGRLLSNGKDLCDCLDVDCMGCFYPCPECTSRKCGVECRCDRKWLYEQMEVEGGEIIRNKFAV
uniref:ADP-ribosylation factor-like 14 effector protein n=1 Tax=Amphilophus citrinellus TaxID=61819 RepID=A0A3Q0STT1_AMPCI